MSDDLHQAEEHLNTKLRQLRDELHNTEDGLNTNQQQLKDLGQAKDHLNKKLQRLRNELDHEERILSKKQRRLWALKEQAAILGLNCPVHITLEINDLDQECQGFHQQIEEQETVIKEIEQEIRSLREQIEEHEVTSRMMKQNLRVFKQQIEETEQKIKETIEDILAPPVGTVEDDKVIEEVPEPASPCLSLPPPSILPVLQPVTSPPGSPRFYMAIYLVTNCQYKVFLEDEANAYWRPGVGCVEAGKVDDNYLKHWRNGKYPRKLDHHPIRYVSWYAAQACVHWLGNQLEPPLRLRLPYQDEWEIAAYAGRSGIEWLAEDLNNMINCVVTRGKTEQITTRVDAFHPNLYYLHDLLGNVYELCSLKENVTYSLGDSNAERQVIALGGSYETEPDQLLIPTLLKPNECRSDVGFRCVQGLLI